MSKLDSVWSIVLIRFWSLFWSNFDHCVDPILIIVCSVTRIQRGVCGVQEHKLYSLGCRRPGQDSAVVEALLPEHSGILDSLSLSLFPFTIPTFDLSVIQSLRLPVILSLKSTHTNIDAWFFLLSHTSEPVIGVVHRWWSVNLVWPTHYLITRDQWIWSDQHITSSLENDHKAELWVYTARRRSLYPPA